MRLLTATALLAAVVTWSARAGAQPAISVDEIIEIAASGVGSPYVWGGGCWDPGNRSWRGADCSGFVAKAWQVPDRSDVTVCSHPYSTWNFYNESTHWDHIDRGAAEGGDAYVRRSDGAGHVVLFASGDPWGWAEVYEARGTAYGIVHRDKDIDSSYRARRRRNLIPATQPPGGWIDGVECGASDGWARGWAQDLDNPGASIDVHLYFDGPAGSGAWGIAVHADLHRDDLCDAIGSCTQAFRFRVPAEYLDGARHTIHAYGIDPEGVENPELRGSPYSFSCAPPEPPLAPQGGVLRGVVSPDSLAAWGIAWNEVAHPGDAVLDGYSRMASFPAAPRVVAADGDPGLYVDDHRVRRHVPSPEAFDAWGLDRGAVETITLEELHAMLPGPPLLSQPFAAQGTGATVWLVDHPPALWAEIVSESATAELEAGGRSNGEVTIRLRNRGSSAWAAGSTHLAPVEPRGSESVLCDESTWVACDRAVTLDETVEPGGEVTLRFAVRAGGSAAGTTVTQCWGLVVDGDWWFGDEVQGGPADTALCHDFVVVEQGAAHDPGDDTVDPIRPGSDTGPGGGPGSIPPLEGSCACTATGPGRPASGLPWLLGVVFVSTYRRARQRPRARRNRT